MNKLRVIHILNTGSYSGAENIAVTIIRNTVYEQKVEATYVALKGPIENNLKRANVDYILLDRITRNSLRQVIDSVKPDIIHAHDFRTGVLSSLCNTTVPIINHLHNNSPWMRRNGLYSLVYRLASKRFDKILCVSSSVVDEYVYKESIKDKSIVIGNIFDRNRIIRLAGGIDSQKSSDVLFCGRLTEQKNPIRFIDVISEINKTRMHVDAIMIGDGDLKDSVIKYVSDNKLNETIKILGFSDNPYEYFYNTRILCMTSDWEGFGLVAVEALTLGKPVVCTPVGGLVDLVDSSCGRICHDNEEFIDEITKLLSDSEYYENKCNQAINRSVQLDTSTEYINSIIDVYNQVLQCRLK